MKNKTILFTVLLSVMLSAAAFAQENGKQKADSAHHPMNFFKVNLAALIIKDYSFQYERIINRKFSFAIGFGSMPNSSIPFKNNIIKALGDDQETIDAIKDMTLSNTTITPEFRWYASKKGYGRGFYLAPFYRYGVFKGAGLTVNIDGDVQAKQNSLTMSGKITGNSVGLLIGFQKSWGKHLSLDTWLIGPHYGNGKGEFNGVSAAPLSQSEQDDLRQTLEDIDLPLTTKTIIVTQNGATVKLDGPFAGVRLGIVLGYKF